MIGLHAFNKKTSQEEVYTIASYKMHERYDPLGYPNDIAIIKVNGSIRFGMYVQPVCLPRKQRKIPIGTQCYVTGEE